MIISNKNNLLDISWSAILKIILAVIIVYTLYAVRGALLLVFLV